jgi:hypothetical protein
MPGLSGVAEKKFHAVLYPEKRLPRNRQNPAIAKTMSFKGI